MVKDDRSEQALDTYRELVRADLTVGTLMGRQLKNFGVGVGQFRILERLLHRGPTGQKELGEQLFAGDSNVSQILDRLEAGSWIVRRTKDGYKRQNMIDLTAQGRALIEMVFPRQVKLIRAQMAALSRREQDTLRKLCRRAKRWGRAAVYFGVDAGG